MQILIGQALLCILLKFTDIIPCIWCHSSTITSATTICTQNAVKSYIYNFCCSLHICSPGQRQTMVGRKKTTTKPNNNPWTLSSSLIAMVFFIHVYCIFLYVVYRFIIFLHSIWVNCNEAIPKIALVYFFFQCIVSTHLNETVITRLNTFSQWYVFSNVQFKS